MSLKEDMQHANALTVEEIDAAATLCAKECQAHPVMVSAKKRSLLNEEILAGGLDQILVRLDRLTGANGGQPAATPKANGGMGWLIDWLVTHRGLAVGVYRAVALLLLGLGLRLLTGRESVGELREQLAAQVLRQITATLNAGTVTNGVTHGG